MSVARSHEPEQSCVIKSVDRFRALEVRGVEQPGISLELCERLSAQRTKKMPIVDSRESGRDMTRSALQVVGHGDRCRTDDSVINALPRSPRNLSKTLPSSDRPANSMGHSAALAETRSSANAEIAGFARVIESRSAIGLIAAAAKNQEVRRPPAPRRLAKKTGD